MVRNRLSRFTVALALAAVPLSVLAPAQASSAESQTITFTSAAPTNAVFNRTSNLGDYVPTAVASSGLPVRFSVDPASQACAGQPGVIGEPGSEQVGDRITVRWLRPGTCTIFADQAGDGRFAPATRVAQSFEIAKEDVLITAPKVGKALLGLSSTTFTAELRHETRFGPGYLTVGYPDQVISFSVAGKVLCTARTVARGDLFSSTAVATCKAPIGLGSALTASTYRASYAGNELSNPAGATGRLG